MVKKNRPDLYPKGLVYISTHSETFDCVGRIKKFCKGEYNSYKDRTESYYLVEVKSYTKGNYSKTEQKYYIHEIKNIMANMNKKTVSLLYTGD